jgi:hypothetical protein
MQVLKAVVMSAFVAAAFLVIFTQTQPGLRQTAFLKHLFTEPPLVL